jgi:sulfur dioxygenase
LWNERIFTGDALLINGCGRTDFQGGDAGMLFDSITTRLFSLPDETLIYPAHDYNGKHVSTVAQEKASNKRIAGKTRAEFIAIMANLNLPKPSLIDIAVPANRMCGIPEENLPQG